MSWEDILKRRRLTPEEHERYYGKVNRSGAAKEAKRKREAILNDPEIKEKARINRLKKTAENIISNLEMSNKMIEEELDSYKTWPAKPKEREAGIDWEKTRDVASSNVLSMVEQYEKTIAYIDFLRKAMKSNFEGIEDNAGGLYSLRSGKGRFEGIEADIGNTNRAVRAKYNEIARRLNWEIMGQ